MKRTRKFALGDQHGNLKGVIQCLDLCKFDYKTDQLINLGDIVDGYPESAELVQFWIEFTKKCKIKPIFIRGNHDWWCKEYLLYGQTPTNWTQQGGESTISSYINTGHLVSEEHRQFFKNQVNYYIDEDNKAFVHGGYYSQKGLGHEDYQATYYWDRDLWQTSLSGKKSQEMPKILRPHKEIFIGHTATTFWDKTVPMNNWNVWNLDTGSGWKGRLTIMDIESKNYWQSSFSEELYGKNQGR